MQLDSRTPVLVGCGVAQQREEDPAKALEPLGLMQLALERASDDAGCPSLLSQADEIRIPRGFWSYPDPGRLLAERFGAPGARTEIHYIGVLQTTLLGGAAAKIAAGEADVVLLTGGEARHRSSRARALGVEEIFTAQPEGRPDRSVEPDADLVHQDELEAGFLQPAAQFAAIENALRADEGLSLEDHRKVISDLWAELSRIASRNPRAWSRQPLSAEAIGQPGPKNRMVAFPYTRLHCSNWNVDQGVGLILCSVGKARALGIPRERWVFPLAIADSRANIPLLTRRDLHRSQGFAAAGERALARAELDVTDIRYLELYSCFPSAVRVQCRELEIPEGQAISQTGGMAFAGGPLNHFSLQVLPTLADALRSDPGSAGMLTAVSSMLTKQGVSLWSSEPGPGFAFDDVSRETEARTPRLEAGPPRGRARLAGYTVLYHEERPWRSMLICDLEDGRRTLVPSEDRDLSEALTREEPLGRPLRLDGPGSAALL